jgi:hypothetical protein
MRTTTEGRRLLAVPPPDTWGVDSVSHEAGSEAQEHVVEADGRSNTVPRRSFMGRVTGTLKFFAPSLLVGLVAPFLFPAVRRAARPVVKGIIKGALSLGESMRERTAGAREQMSDLLAEVRAERDRQSVESASSTKENV